MEQEEIKVVRQREDASKSISGMFLEHATFLKRFLAKFLNNEQDIEDVAQEAYLKAYTAEQEKGVIDHPKAFLFSIAKNLALNELTRKSRQMTDYIEECQPQLNLDGTTSLENELDAEYSIGLYCDAVANLPEKCRRVYLLRKVHGLTHKEICARLGVSRSTVEKYISMGSISCRDYISRRNQQYPIAVPVRRSSSISQIGNSKNG